MNVLISKLSETVFAVLPITLLVLLLHFTIAPLGTEGLLRFLLGALAIVIGLATFLFGVDIAISPVGQAMGRALARRRSLALLIAAGIVLGFFINVAEPNLLVVAGEINTVTGGQLATLFILVVASIGVGVMVAIGLTRIVMKVPLKNMLLVIFAGVTILAVIASNDLLGIAMDTGGATTGSMTVPFLLALGIGVSAVHGGKKGEEDSFGLTAIATTGPMFAVLAMAIFARITDLAGSPAAPEAPLPGIWLPFGAALLGQAKDVAMAICPIIVLTLIAQFTLMHLPKYAFRRMLKGFLYTYLGFVLFLTGVTTGFMSAGQVLGALVTERSIPLVIAVGAVLGLLVILAEPSVHVLTAEVEEASGGAIGRRMILIALALGVSVAIALSIFRIVTPGVMLWHLILPGYLLALLLSRITPPLFVGIAFDSGSVASGPMTATFILAFAQGAARAVGGQAGLVEAFGVIAMVAMTPIIALQIFGIIYGRKEAKLKAAQSHGAIAPGKE